MIYILTLFLFSLFIFLILISFCCVHYSAKRTRNIDDCEQQDFIRRKKVQK